MPLRTYSSSWDVEVTDTFRDWYAALPDADADAVTWAVDMLADRGPALKRPLVGGITGSSLGNLKELRTGSMRILFAFDPRRTAILLLGGSKGGRWRSWYRRAIPEAERLYAEYLVELGRERSAGEEAP